MARPLAKARSRPPFGPLAAVATVAVLVIGGLLVMTALGEQPATTPHTSPSSPVALGSREPSAAASPSSTTLPTTAPSVSPKESPLETPDVSETPAATPRQVNGRAPTTPAGFDLARQIVDIGFPLRADTQVRYRDNWLDRRAGSPDPYNHARVLDDGRLVRLHDGIDLYAAEGSPVLSPFDGTVIDPSTRWSPWEPDRYGLTVVIESDEPTSDGYTAVLVHLHEVWVDVGQHVARGQVIGDLGESGNAEGIRPQLHFELRAPFLLDWSPIGENRSVDAFNPFPSLEAADPNL